MGIPWDFLNLYYIPINQLSFMEKLTKLVLIIVIIGLVLDLLLGPGLLLLAGIALLFLLWGIQGGLTEGNPYKRMRYSALPDFVEVKDYMRKEDIEIRDNADAYVTIYVFIIGASLIAVDVFWAWLNGWL